VCVCLCVYIIIDQTPTPTRFLRNVEESGLFQELADNPFDQVQQLHSYNHSQLSTTV
jgi:hypothetical protein